MKNLMNWLSMVCLALTFVACGPSSVKGKWTDADKKLTKESIIKETKANLAAQGQSAAMDDASVEKYADCFVSKAEAELDGPSSFSESNLANRQKISAACMQEMTVAPTEGGTQPTEGQAADSTQTPQ